MSLLQREMTFTVKTDKQKILCQKLKMHFNIFLAILTVSQNTGDVVWIRANCVFPHHLRR